MVSLGRSAAADRQYQLVDIIRFDDTGTTRSTQLISHRAADRLQQSRHDYFGVCADGAQTWARANYFHHPLAAHADHAGGLYVDFCALAATRTHKTDERGTICHALFCLT